MKKKLLSVALAAVLVLSVTACGSNGSDTKSSKENDVEASVETSTEVSTEASTEVSTEVSTETSTEASVEASVETSTETSTETKENTKKASYNFTDHSSQILQTEAIQFANNITVGWNLGNTFDAKDGSNGLSYETYWQPDKTTPEFIQAVKDAGFNTLRLPVSWHNHVDSNNKIDAAWLARVKEVVDYAMDADMYVILNIHHDVSKFFIYPTSEYRAQSNKFIEDIWSQLSETFKDYDERLMFESMNETRLVGTNEEWWLNPSSDACKDAVDCINDYNQTFVDVVRKSGGNNATRYLVIPGYCTSADGITNSGFVIPTDSSNADPHIILAVHSYTPYDFALNNDGTDTWSSLKYNDTKEINDMMLTIYSKYVKNGVPIIIDEFGALDKKGNTEARADHAGYFVGLAKSYGMSCVWWDNNNTTNSGERFALFNRKTGEAYYPEIVESIMSVLE